MQKQKNKLAFSLIELSVVILIIGILIIGITKSSRIISQTKISSAKSLSTSSPVTTTPDLVVWYETSLPSSFSSTDTIDGKVVSGSWFNNSQSKDNNTTTITGNPTYYQSVINNLPAIRFDGASGFNFDANPMTGKYYTVFVVEQRRSSGSSNRILSLGTVSAPGYVTNTSIDAPYISVAAPVPAYNSNGLIPRILTFMTGSTSGSTRGIFINGGTGSVPAVTASDSVISTIGIGRIGQGLGTFYTGDIAEVIIFNRTLTLSERNSIQGYLGQKYAIKVTPSI